MEWRHTGNSGKRANGYTRLFDTWHERDVRAWVRVARNHPSVILYGIGNGIVFSIEGPGEIVAKDNGDETDFDDFRQPRRKAFHGWAQAVIRAIPGAVGTIRVTAASGDLVPTSLSVEAR